MDQQGDKTVNAIRDELNRALAKQESAAAARDAKRAEEAAERERKHAAKMQELMDAQRASEDKIQPEQPDQLEYRRKQTMAGTTGLTS